MLCKVNTCFAPVFCWLLLSQTNRSRGYHTKHDAFFQYYCRLRQCCQASHVVSARTAWCFRTFTGSQLFCGVTVVSQWQSQCSSAGLRMRPVWSNELLCPFVQSRSQAGSDQEPKASSYFGDSKDKMEDLPALPKAENAAGTVINTDRKATRGTCQLVCTIQTCSQTNALCFWNPYPAAHFLLPVILYHQLETVPYSGLLVQCQW